METEYRFKFEIEIPFPTIRSARIAYDVVRVDKEPKRSGVVKAISIKENVLTANFSAELAKQLRVAVNSFLEKIDIISETIDTFGPPVSESYSHY